MSRVKLVTPCSSCAKSRGPLGTIHEKCLAWCKEKEIRINPDTITRIFSRHRSLYLIVFMKNSIDKHYLADATNVIVSFIYHLRFVASVLFSFLSCPYLFSLLFLHLFGFSFFPSFVSIFESYFIFFLTSVLPMFPY